LSSALKAALSGSECISFKLLVTRTRTPVHCQWTPTALVRARLQAVPVALRGPGPPLRYTLSYIRHHFFSLTLTLDRDTASGFCLGILNVAAQLACPG
jgi:hypothetical protein